MEIKVEQLTHLYGKGTPFEHRALEGVSLTIPAGSFAAFIGHTGSGKSTLIQHFNGLLKPDNGTVTIGNTVIRAGEKTKRLQSLRRKVGIVFQYPEHQLFEETVEKDISYGPRNFGATESEALDKAHQAAELVGLERALLQRSPFELSGGQMRRAAIAGVLAMEPEVLILDEPTAGLDPRGRHEMMELFARLHREKKLTTVLVTHQMEDAARYADMIFVMHRGRLLQSGTAEDIFQNPSILQQAGLDIPESIALLCDLEKKFDVSLEKRYYSDEELAALICRLLPEGVQR